jgi:hypothetical protein
VEFSHFRGTFKLQGSEEKRKSDRLYATPVHLENAKDASNLQIAPEKPRFTTAKNGETALVDNVKEIMNR